MTEQGTAAAQDDAQEPEEVQEDTTNGAPSAGPDTQHALTERQRTVLTRMIRVAYPHDRFPDGPYERTATAVEEAGAAAEEEFATLSQGLDALDADAGGDFVSLDEAGATAALEKIDSEAFFRQVHATCVVALYDDREVWGLLGYEGPSFDKGGYVDRGFDDLDWLPDPHASPSTTSPGSRSPKGARHERREDSARRSRSPRPSSWSSVPGAGGGTTVAGELCAEAGSRPWCWRPGRTG